VTTDKNKGLDVVFYDLKEVSELLNLTNRTLLTYIKTGKLKAKKLGRKWIVMKEDLESMIRGSTSSDTEEKP
jgi:excisionase family DNA binding protein